MSIILPVRSVRTFSCDDEFVLPPQYELQCYGRPHRETKCNS